MIRITFLLIFCIFADISYGKKLETSPYEKRFIETKVTIESLMPDSIMLFGMVLDSNFILLNIKVHENAGLALFFKRIEKHPKFENPDIVIYNDRYKPGYKSGFVLVRIDIVK